jgi:hypothetical protein
VEHRKRDFFINLYEIVRIFVQFLKLKQVVSFKAQRNNKWSFDVHSSCLKNIHCKVARKNFYTRVPIYCLICKTKIPFPNSICGPFLPTLNVPSLKWPWVISKFYTTLNFEVVISLVRNKFIIESVESRKNHMKLFNIKIYATWCFTW